MKLPGLSSTLNMNSFTANSSAEKNMWLLWDQRVNVEIMDVYAQSLTVKVTYWVQILSFSLWCMLAVTIC